jgi:hypothetical protein
MWIGGAVILLGTLVAILPLGRMVSQEEQQWLGAA